MQALVRTVVACSRPVGAGRVLARGLRQAGASIIRGRAAEKKARPFQEIDPLDCVWVPVLGSPHLFLGHERLPGVPHWAPPARVLEAHVSSKGSFGKKKYKSEEIIQDWKDASFEIGINQAPLPNQTEAVNPDFVEYEAWLNKLYERLLDHVTQHISSYPVLATAVPRHAGPMEIREHILKMAMGPARREKDEQGNEREDTNYVYYKTPMYKFPSGEHQREEVPVYEKGELLELHSRSADVGDVVRVCATVDGELHKFDDRLFLGMQRILNAVEVLERHNKPS